MQRLISIRAGFVLLLLMLMLVSIVTFVASATTTYSDPNDRFSFTAPESYIQRFRAGTDVSFRSESTPTSSFEITVIPQIPDLQQDADTVVANALKGLKLPTYMVGNTGVQSTTLVDQSARRFDYYTTREGVSIRTHTLEIVAVTAKAAYILIFTATETNYSQMLNDTAIVLGSFSFAGVGPIVTTTASITGAGDVVSIMVTPSTPASFGTLSTPMSGTPSILAGTTSVPGGTAAAPASIGPAVTMPTPTAVIGFPTAPIAGPIITQQATFSGRASGIAPLAPQVSPRDTRDGN